MENRWIGRFLAAAIVIAGAPLVAEMTSDGPYNDSIHGLLFHEGATSHESVTYVFGENGLYESRNETMWTRILPGVVLAAAVDEDTVDGDAALYAGLRSDGVWRRTDGGWTQLLEKRTVFALLARNGDVFAGTSGGLQRFTAGVWSPSGLDGLGVRALLAVGETLLAGTSRGVFRSADGGETWTDLELTASAVQALTWDEPFGRVFAGSTRGELFRSTDGGNTFEAMPFPGGASIRAIAVDVNLFVATEGKGVYFDLSRGDNWSRMNRRLLDKRIRALTWADGLLLAGTPSGMYASDGTDWFRASEGLGPAEIEALVVDRNDRVHAVSSQLGLFSYTRSRWNLHGLDLPAGIFDVDMGGQSEPSYGATARGLFRRDQGSRKWVRVEGEEIGLSVRAVAVDPQDAQRVFAADNRALFLSGDGGRTWTELLERRRIHTIEVGTEAVYVAPERFGILISADGGATWQNELADENVRALDRRRVDDEVVLVAATETGVLEKRGGGAWQMLTEGAATKAVAVSSGAPVCWALGAGQVFCDGQLLADLGSEVRSLAVARGRVWAAPRGGGVVEIPLN